MEDKEYRVCTKTVMDTIGDPDITFDENGVCNYFYEYSAKLKIRVPPLDEGKRKLDAMVKKIKAAGKGKDYDCIIGVSGGVDSTYTAWLVKELGLRPLAVHLDNGWNSELAVKNIENILSKLDIDLYTEVLDWEMFKDLQLSFLKASTPDSEIPTDHAIVSVMYKLAAKYKVKYIISGMNFRNEGLLPPTWGRGYLDWKYIKGIQRKFGTQNIISIPHFSIFQFLYWNLVKKIRSVSFINYIDFKKDEAIKVIEKELDWKNYGEKHYESIYTRFFQAYILPNKFKIDKRKAHLTCQIISSGTPTREEAIEHLKKDVADIELMEKDKIYLLKKFDITCEEFDSIMNAPIKSILDYPNNYSIEFKFRKALLQLRKWGILPN